MPSSTPTGLLAGHSVSRVGFGAMQLERLKDDRPAAIDLVQKAVELGVNHFDTAEFYGHSFVNGVLRDALADVPDAVIVSKVGADPTTEGPIPLKSAQRPEQLRASVEDNLRSLGLDQIPVVNLRRLDSPLGLQPEGDQIVDLDDQLAVMAALRDEGKIGAIGLSTVTLDGLRRALPLGIVCVQNAYNLLSRGDEDLLTLCEAEGIAWVPYFPLGSAFDRLPNVTDAPAVQAAAASTGFTASQVGLAWLLQHSPSVLLIPGTADPAHLEANVAAGSVHLDEATMASLDAVPDVVLGGRFD